MIHPTLAVSVYGKKDGISADRLSSKSPRHFVLDGRWFLLTGAGLLSFPTTLLNVGMFGVKPGVSETLR